MNQGVKRGRGRPPKYEAAMTGAERQSLYAKARQRDMAEVAYALKDALRTKADRKAFDIYRGNGCVVDWPVCSATIRSHWRFSTASFCQMTEIRSCP
jgi:hypothetical protein